MNTDQHLNTGAMALGALPDDEAASFAEHLQDCVSCSDELSGFLETAATLGGSVAQTPPASLRRSVMEAISRTPQLPPLTGPVTVLGRHRQAPDQAPAVGESPRAAVGAQEVTPDHPVEHLATVLPLHRPWYRRPQALLAAAVALLVIGGGTGVVLSNRSSSPPSASACVAAANDKSVLKPTVGTGGDVTLAPSCDAAVVTVPAIPAPPAGSVYQLWVIKGSSASSAGVIKQNADGSISAIPTIVRAGDSAVGVTVEPSPGSVKPTTKPFWVVPLAS